MSKTFRLAIIGTYPPPYGGVSTHLERLRPYLDKEGLDYVFYNTSPTVVEHPRVVNVGWSVLWLFKMFFFSSHKVLHFHTSRWWVRFLAACIHITRGTRIIFTAHGISLPNSISSSNPLKRFLCRWALKQTEIVIATNEHIRESLINKGFPEDKIFTLPAFIPPTNTSQAQIPAAVSLFCKGHSPILMANGGLILIDGKDVYGLRVMVDLIEELRKDFPEIGLVVFLRAGADTHASAFADVLEKVKATALSKNILFYESKGVFAPSLRFCDIFLRPTTTDGDSNSIREAFYFGVPVVTSDVVPRPSGCLLYPIGNNKAFTHRIIDILNNLDQEKSRILALEQHNPAVELVKIYNQLIG